jgi:hypothetical protein
MSGDLYVQTDGVRSYAQIHDQVVSGLSQLMGAAAPEAAGVQTSHGTIATAVSTALSNVLGSRQATMQTTATSGTTIAELLQKAAALYERGDEHGAEKLRAAAEAMQGGEGANSAGGAGAATGGAAGQAGGAAQAGSGAAGSGGGAAQAGSGAADSGGEMVGQMLGQLRQVGQTAGQLTQPLQALSQGLQQVPQQVMQGVQQAVQAGQKDLGTGDHALPPPPGQDHAPAPNGDHAPASTGDHAPPPDKKSTGAAPGASAGTGRAPDLPRAGAESGQTRPVD